jgi:phage anti-repressor protein
MIYLIELVKTRYCKYIPKFYKKFQFLDNNDSFKEIVETSRVSESFDKLYGIYSL